MKIFFSKIWNFFYKNHRIESRNKKFSTYVISWKVEIEICNAPNIQ